MGHSDEWLRRGVAAVVITRGEAGMAAVTHAGVIDVPAVSTPVVDTIGAGDTTHAALLARLYAHGALHRDRLTALDARAWRDVLGFAALAASHTCARPGAEPPTAAELSAPEPPQTPVTRSRH
jgi:fructokinase